MPVEYLKPKITKLTNIGEMEIEFDDKLLIDFDKEMIDDSYLLIVI
jgi:hypothetical protein